MKELAILRHAKSSWAEPGLSDETRPLNPRGLRQCEMLSGWLSANTFQPDRIFCSTAKRTRQTYDGIRSTFGTAAVEFLPKMYLGEMEDYLDAIWSAENSASILLIGHNPTCDELVRYLAKPSSPAMEKLMASHFSTGTFALFEFEGDDWSNVGEASCLLRSFTRPKDIELMA